MAKLCLNCKKQIPLRYKIDGKIRNLQTRKYCFECSPFGSGNTRKLHLPQLDPILKRKRDNQRYKKWQRRARKERKQKLIAMLGGCCCRCGYKKCIYALDFHHKDPTIKNFGLSTKGFCRKWEILVEEAKKCILLCKNCHAEIHWQLNNDKND